MAKNPYYVLSCDEPDGTRTWDVVRRANDVNGTTVANHRSRQAARNDAAARNARASSGKSGMISQRMDDAVDAIDKKVTDLKALLGEGRIRVDESNSSTGGDRRWSVYVNGELLRSKNGVGMRYKTRDAAERAGRKALDRA